MSKKLIAPSQYTMGPRISYAAYMRLSFPCIYRKMDIRFFAHDVDHFEACGNFTKVIMIDPKLIYSMDLKITKVSLLLPENFFDQSHRCNISNMATILGLHTGIKPYYFTKFGIAIFISRDEILRVRDLMSRFTPLKGVVFKRIRSAKIKVKKVKPVILLFNLNRKKGSTGNFAAS